MRQCDSLERGHHVNVESRAGCWLEAPILVWRLNCVYVGVWWDEKYAFSLLKWTFLSYYILFSNSHTFFTRNILRCKTAEIYWRWIARRKKIALHKLMQSIRRERKKNKIGSLLHVACIRCRRAERSHILASKFSFAFHQLAVSRMHFQASKRQRQNWPRWRSHFRPTLAAKTQRMVATNCVENIVHLHLLFLILYYYFPLLRPIPASFSVASVVAPFSLLSVRFHFIDQLLVYGDVAHNGVWQHYYTESQQKIKCAGNRKDT